jgi:hypothetical protein
MVPRHEMGDEFDPDHSRTFEVVVFLADRKLGRGVGKSKQEAKIEAAKDALRSILDGQAAPPGHWGESSTPISRSCWRATLTSATISRK